MIGKVISHYQIIEEIGRGGMGVVYKAEDTKLKRTVALKFLPATALTSETEKTRFIHEAQAAAALNHPNICTIHEIDEFEGQPFIAMEFVEGMSLKQMLYTPLTPLKGGISSEHGASSPLEGGQGGVTDLRPLPVQDVLNLAIQIAEGLQAAHEKGIIHRDMKCDNVMVNEKGVAKIMDFGLAKLAGRTVVTKEGTTLGTIHYMSPEQARGEKVDHRTDIWSFGVMLYEMATGQLPFRGEYEQAIVYSVMNEEPEPPTALRSGVPMELERIILKAIAKKPGERYQHASEIAVDLKRIAPKLAPGKTKSPAARAQPRARNRSFWYGAATIFVVLLFVAGFYLFSKGFFIKPEKTIDSIAVLPLDNLSRDPGQDYFVDGMHEALITDISKISALKVISRTSVMRYKQTDKTMPEIARELGVDALVEGSVLRVGDQVRITAQLIHGSTDEHIWAANYDRDLSNVLALLSEVARAIAGEIQVALTQEQKERLASTRPANPKAQEAYLRGRYFFNTLNPRGFEKAIQYYQEAIAIDSSFALAWAALGGVYIIQAYFQLAPTSEALAKGKAAALKALELNDGLALTYTTLGWYELVNWNWSAAEKQFRRALELDPNDIYALHGYGDYLTVLGRGEEGVAYLKRARDLDPFSPATNLTYVSHLYLARKYDEVLDESQKLIELDSTYVARVRSLMRRSFWQKGMYEEVVQEYKKSWREREPELLETLEQGYAKDGPRGAMRAVAEKMIERSESKPVGADKIAFYFARAGEVESTLQWLEKAVENPGPTAWHFLLSPDYDLVRSEPRFQSLLLRLGMPANKTARDK